MILYWVKEDNRGNIRHIYDIYYLKYIIFRYVPIIRSLELKA